MRGSKNPLEAYVARARKVVEKWAREQGELTSNNPFDAFDINGLLRRIAKHEVKRSHTTQWTAKEPS